MYCPSCGAEYSGGGRFCSNCGARLETDVSKGIPPTGAAATTFQKSKKKNLPLLITFGAIAIFVVFCIVYAPIRAKTESRGAAESAIAIGLSESTSVQVEKHLRRIPEGFPGRESLAKHYEGLLAKEEIVNQQERKQEEAREKKWLSSRAGRIWQRRQDWPKEICEVIAKNKVRIGMTEEQCLASWGRPSDVNNTTYSFGTHSQWCYGEYCESALYFENGILISIQN